jgi:hypothetical protein
MFEWVLETREQRNSVITCTLTFNLKNEKLQHQISELIAMKCLILDDIDRRNSKAICLLALWITTCQTFEVTRYSQIVANYAWRYVGNT